MKRRCWWLGPKYQVRTLQRSIWSMAPLTWEGCSKNKEGNRSGGIWRSVPSKEQEPGIRPGLLLCPAEKTYTCTHARTKIACVPQMQRENLAPSYLYSTSRVACMWTQTDLDSDLTSVILGISLSFNFYISINYTSLAHLSFYCCRLFAQSMNSC